jgi:dipeptidyl aminopeptidase/acylaminoacyl peptidase
MTREVVGNSTGLNGAMYMRSRNVLRTLRVVAATSICASSVHINAQPAGIAPALIPLVSEDASPVDAISPVARDGHHALGFVRKPPGAGPFPAVILIHGGAGSRPAGMLRPLATAPAASTFLAAGYVVVAITYRGRDDDPQPPVSLEDSLAAIEHVRQLPYVDPQSIGVYGCSGGGNLALEIIVAETSVRAVVLEEPASIIFTGIFNARFPKAGPRYTAADARPIGDNPKGYYTPEYQKLTRTKIERIKAPILIIHSDQEPTLTRFNNEVFIPELRSAGKNLEVRSFTGEPHCFAFNGQAAQPANVIKALEDAESFFRRHVNTQPKAVDSSLIRRVPLGRFVK